MSATRALMTGAGGFIGHHLVSYLKEKGYRVRISKPAGQGLPRPPGARVSSST